MNWRSEDFATLERYCQERDAKLVEEILPKESPCTCVVEYMRCNGCCMNALREEVKRLREENKRLKEYIQQNKEFDVDWKF